MKELSIEEKAKRYDEAIEKAKDYFNSPRTCFDIEQLCNVFPELKESGDESIRKEIISYFQEEIPQCSIQEHANKMKEFISWLEKQGEQKPIESMPEFKEGDILYNKDSYASDSIFIFKGMSDKTNAYLCYARLYNKKDFSVYSKENWDEGVGIYGGEFYPANHKQKELLFSEIEKAGYKWNPDKKKMEKIEQNPAFEMKTPEESLGVDSDTYNKIVDECVYGEQKPAWSEEDEAGLGDALWAIEQARTIAKDENDMGNLWYAERWLKSLKDRVQPQQEQKWSEEDDRMLDKCIKAACSNYYPGISSVRDWLKSLKNRYTWKPSEGQLECLAKEII